MNVESLIQHYSGLDESEQAKFDKRYRELMKFRRRLNRMVKAVNKLKDGELSDAANDDSPAALVAAHHNYELRQPTWCKGHNIETKEVYYREFASGAHGWMCTICRGITQTG